VKVAESAGSNKSRMGRGPRAAWRRLTLVGRAVVFLVFTVLAGGLGILGWLGIGPSTDASSESNQDFAVPLVRYRAPAPATANTLSVTGDSPLGWSTEPALGLAYERGEDRTPGLVPIYQQRCIDGCAEGLVYAFSSTSTWARDKWMPEGEAFRCFDAAHAPEGTRPLQELMNDGHARTYAVPGTAYYEEATSNGFSDLADPALCYIWPPDTAG
jgi:hypothetical protein